MKKQFGSVFNKLGLSLWRLKPLSTIFQLYRGMFSIQKHLNAKKKLGLLHQVF